VSKQTEQVETTLAKTQSSETAIEQRAMTPVEMLSVAVQKGADPSTVEKLMDLNDRLEKNRARKAFEQAMVNFSSRVPTIIKTRTVDFATAKGRTHYKHAGLPETVEQIQELMAECQLSRRWKDEDPKKPGNIRWRVIITHVNGHSETVAAEAPPDTSGSKNEAQAVASTVTYLQRLTLFSALGLVAADTVDDDGHGAAPPQQKPAGLVGPTGTEDDKRAFVVVLESAVGKKLAVPERIAYVREVAEFAKLATIAECTEWLRDHGAIVDGKVCNKDTKKKAESPGTGNFAVTGPGTPSEREPGDDGIEPSPRNEQS
jgi:hypothetical protein